MVGLHRVCVYLSALAALVGSSGCAQQGETPGDSEGCPPSHLTERYELVGDMRICGGCDPRCRLTTDRPNQDDLDNDDRVWPASTEHIPAVDGIQIVPPGVRVTSMYAWLANTAVSTVTKVHMQRLRAEGVYRVGLKSLGSGGNDPSRTTVDILGCSYVASRALGGGTGCVTKIAGDEEDCVDLNGNGRIDTSSGIGDIRGWPGDPDQDECILWNRPVGRRGDRPRALAVDALGRIWVGLYNAHQFVVLDSVDGHVISTVNVGLAPYGAAIANDGLLWTTTIGTAIQSINTYTAFPTDADVGLVRTPPRRAYGMAVDMEARVFLAETDNGGIVRYTPSTDTFDYGPNTGGRSTGVVVDEFGVAYTGDIGDHEVTMYDADSLAVLDVFDLAAGGGLRPKGVCPDFWDRVWAANMGSANVSVIEPTVVVVATIPVQYWNYTYSYFTGYGLLSFASMVGYVYRDYSIL